MLAELQENRIRNDLTGAERKAFAAEVGRICQNLNGLSNEGGLSNLDKSWLVDIAEKIGQTRQTLHNWWSAFCKETGRGHPIPDGAILPHGKIARPGHEPNAQPRRNPRRARMEEGKRAAESGMDLKQYAERAGKKRTTLQDKLYAYIVMSAVPDIRHEFVKDNWAQLTQIHAAPEWLWAGLVTAMIEGGWTVATTRAELTTASVISTPHARASGHRDYFPTELSRATTPKPAISLPPEPENSRLFS